MNIFVFLAIMTQDMPVIREIGRSLGYCTFVEEKYDDMEEQETICFFYIKCRG